MDPKAQTKNASLQKFAYARNYKTNQHYTPDGIIQVKLMLFRKRVIIIHVPEMSEYSSALKVSSFSVGRLTKAFMAGK